MRNLRKPKVDLRGAPPPQMKENIRFFFSLPMFCCLESLGQDPGVISSQPRAHTQIPQPGLHSQDSTARVSPQGFHSQDFTAMIQPPGFHSQDSTARIPQPGFHSQDSTAVVILPGPRRQGKSDSQRKHANLDSTYNLSHFAHIRHPPKS